MTGWRLRPAGPADLDAIMALETSIFTSDAWSRATMRAELAGGHGHYLVAVDQGDTGPDAVIGYAGLLALAAAADADVQTIAVAPAKRGQGIGSALLQALLDEAVRRGVDRVFLEVRADNPVAQQLYRGFGFASIGVRRGYYQPDGVDAIVMSRAVTDAASATSASAPGDAPAMDAAPVPDGASAMDAAPATHASGPGDASAISASAPGGASATGTSPSTSAPHETSTEVRHDG